MSGLARRSRCIRCCISMKFADPIPRFPSPGIPPKPPRPNGDAPMSAGLAEEAAGVAVGAVAGEAGGEAAAAAAPPADVPAADCLITR